MNHICRQVKRKSYSDIQEGKLLSLLFSHEFHKWLTVNRSSLTLSSHCLEMELQMMWLLALWPVSDVCHTNVLSLCTKNITRYPVWEQRWQIARAHLTTGADPGIQPLCHAEKHSPINTRIMKEDKCFCSRLQVDRVSMLVLLLSWSTVILQS